MRVPVAPKLASSSRANPSVIRRDSTFGRLGREVRHFANHTQRLLRASQRWRTELQLAEEWSEGAAALSVTPLDPEIALRAVDKFARVHRHDRAELLGAYFAHHHLRLQAEQSLHLLRAFRDQGRERAAIFHEAQEHAEAVRRRWVASLLELTILAAAPDLSRQDFAAFNVGALTDHEDVDLAIVIHSNEGQAGLAQALSTVSRTFVRYASKIQLFLTEQLLVPRTGARIEEYAQLLERPDRGVVAVMQLLGAQFLCGHEPLARALDERVIRACYAGQGSPMIHESFLRGVMAELRWALSPRGVAGVLSPKREIYVPAKLTITALRVIYGVEETQPAKALLAVAQKAPEIGPSCRALADLFVENEVLRALLFLYVFPSDELDLVDPGIRSAARRVAWIFGLGLGRPEGPDRLHPAYVRLRQKAVRAIGPLTQRIDDHLARVSTFRQIVVRQADLPPLDNLVIHLLQGLERYEGSVFWDEVVQPLSAQISLGERFVEDLSRLAANERAAVARRYLRLLVVDPLALIEFLIFLSRRDRAGVVDPPRESAVIYWDALLDYLSADREALLRFTHGLDTEATSDAVYRWAVATPPFRLGALADLLDAHELGPPGFRVARALRSVVVLVHHHSNAIGRISSRVLGRQPEFVPRLGDARRLQELSREIGHEATHERRPREQIELLGDALDVVALQAGLTAVLEGAPAGQDAEHTRAVDTYVRELWNAGQRELLAHGQPPPGSEELHGLGIWVTGGYGRGEAFGADWDYLAILDPPAPELARHYGRVIQRVSTAMARRGLHPHNRLIDHFNAFVVDLPSLERYFEARRPETFIDEAEALEARFFIGDPVVARAFEERIRAPLFGPRRIAFVTDVLHELADRRRTPPRGLNIKLGPGGLREIHLLWLAIRVVARLPAPLSDALLPEAIRALPQAAEDLLALMDANRELRRIRDLYRLVVAIDDAMEPAAMVEIARDLEPLRLAGFGEGFEERLGSRLADTAARVDRVATILRRQLGRGRR